MATTTPAANITAAFVECILAVDFDTLPRQAIEVAKHVVEDTLAVTLAGATHAADVTSISIGYVREQGGNAHASVVAGGFKTSMQNAAYVNGTLANVLEFDAAWSPPNHPASPTVPAIFAIGECRHLSGRAVLEAVVVAFEVQARIRLAGTGLSGGFHKPGVTGLFGAAAAAAKLLKLDKHQTLMALGTAGSRAGSLAVNSGTMAKPSHAGHAARMGIECASLAGMGWTASADVFGPKGYFDTFMSISKPALLLEGFGAPFRMVEPGVGFKAYPCIYLIHRAIDAALALRREFDINPEEIDAVQIVQPPLHSVDRPAPKDSLAAKHSTQYATLIALLDGEVTIDSFTDRRMRAADVGALLNRVQYKADDSIPATLDDMWATVNVTLKNGRQLSRRVDRLAGWMGNSLSLEQRRAKFLSCARPLLDESAALRMLELVDGIETLGDVAEIMDIARGDPRNV
jgi:2-methylcitrate dehydratase PrpD